MWCVIKGCVRAFQIGSVFKSERVCVCVCGHACALNTAKEIEKIL